MTNFSSNRTSDVFVLGTGMEGKRKGVSGKGHREVSVLREVLPSAPLTCRMLLFLSLPELGETDTS